MRAGFFQFEPKFGARDHNLNVVEEAIIRIVADLIVLPELFTTGYQFVSAEEAADLAEEVPGGETTRLLKLIAAEKQMHIVAGMAERSGKQVFNSSILVGPEGLVARYRKTHLFAEEQLWFTPGDTGFA